ncbi:hypothetical protein DH2020_041079 [Rehmannia glutinosa]|uniref:Polygalacturonase n=1 Tax=Rehmannia glutinosa TaxID=99300 RepID=A0ABR0USF6_REHGL
MEKERRRRMALLSSDRRAYHRRAQTRSNQWSRRYMVEPYKAQFTTHRGSGFARNITFSNINFIAANNPVIIDQYYCPHKKCSNKTSAVEVSDVRYYGLHGTSICKNATINLSCSKTVPCNNIILDDVDIESANPNNSITANCINAHGQAHTLNPIVNCLLQ